jgi:RHS repeat-associated protein
MQNDQRATSQSGPKGPKVPEAAVGTSRTAPGQSVTGASTASVGGAKGASSGGTGGGSGPGGAAALLPAIGSPKGGGALRGIGEKFSVNAATGTASLSVPIATSPGRSGFVPDLSLSYDSGSGNGAFGLGFHLSVPAVTRKTDKGLPLYRDEVASDVFVLSGAEDLVPQLGADGEQLSVSQNGDYTAYRYRPRVEGAFVRIERWVHNDTRAVHWRVTTKENVTHIYGLSAGKSQIVDPGDPKRIFSWLLEESRDGKGNVIRYEYKAEDGAGVPFSLSEKSRFDASRKLEATSQRYLKRILYGNRAPSPTNLAREQFLFEVVFDYGEHDRENPSYAEPNPWGVRLDPFSSYRSGFDVRTYRLCHRVLMFHRFEGDGDNPRLVKSTDFRYEQHGFASYLMGVTHRGYVVDVEGAITERGSLPELSFEFQRAELHHELVPLPKESLEGLTGGVDGVRKQWVDLDGEGIPGVLIDANGAWYYKSNLGEGRLSAPKRLATIPSPAQLTAGTQKLEDLGGDGRLDLVQYGKPLQGYFERTAEGSFEPLRYFKSIPNINWNDPNLRFIDLDGDGHGDLLITEDRAFVWYRSKGKEGFEAAQKWFPSRDENRGPAVVFADGTQSIQLADMSGDGLVDIVRVRNGEVCYWPNLGYGKFGAKVTLENSPHFAPRDQFDARRVRFGDVDGSGTTDLLYLGARKTSLYLNESGNRLSPEVELRSVPPVDNVASVSLVDLLGKGTSCLVWSSSLPSAANQPVYYIDLMGGIKPHLLSTVTNNMGARTRITYSTSTAHYLRDKAEGLRWLTRLNFAVQVVGRIVHEDLVTKSELSVRYRYHHGFFDGEEREFRGFACVEQWDTEHFEPTPTQSYQQYPVHTKTWFHTGAWLEAQRLEAALREEYFPKGPKSEDAPISLFLPDTVIEPDALNRPMSTQDAREAARALRGHVLRTEVYSEDPSPVADTPYVITEQNFAVRRLQSSEQAPTGAKHGVFFAYPRETLTIQTERHVEDPRVAHELVLQVSRYGDFERQARVVYGRRGEEHPAEQRRLYSTLTETTFANHDVTPEPGSPALETHRWYRASVQCEQRTWELTGMAPPTGTPLWTVESFLAAITGLPETPYETPVTTRARRLVEHQQQTFCADDGITELALGELESAALPCQGYQLALTPGLVALVTAGAQVLPATGFESRLLTTEGGYVSRSDGYWAPGGRLEYHDSAGFYLPRRAVDPFGHAYTIDHDEHSLLIVATTDPLGNRILATNDYRVLAPREVRDANLNRTAIGFDALGLVVWTAVMSKEGANEGDTPEHPTTRFAYHLHNWVDHRRPVYVKTSAREVHYYPDATDAVPWQDSFTYSDGFGRVVMQKVQAEAGLVRGISGIVEERWVGSGRTVFNNKGKPVKQYEPFFSATSDYEDEAAVVEWGVTPVIYYDPLNRVVLTELPNGTLSRVVFDAWRQETWDPNDTVLDEGCRWYRERTGTGSVTNPTERRAAQLAAAHANTPSIMHLDSLGRAFLVEADNGPAPEAPTGAHRYYATRTELDIEGNPLAITDALGIRTVEQQFDVLGRRIAVTSPDAGARVTIADATGAPLRSWDSRGQVMRSRYDSLRRPTHVLVQQGSNGAATVVTRTVYGESVDGNEPLQPQPDMGATPTEAQGLNLRGRTYLVFDGAGLVRSEEFDFKGNLRRATRHLASEYYEVPDWNALPDLVGTTSPADVEDAAAGALEEPTTPGVPTQFTTCTDYDALNRVISSEAPDGSVSAPQYNRAGLLERMLVTAGGATRAAVHSMEYNEKGQRLACEYSGEESPTGAFAYRTTYSYDPETFRLQTMVTRRRSPEALLQSLEYTYDPVGNIVEVLDNGTPISIYSNAAAQAHGRYEYDALYRLTVAEGREHPGQQVGDQDERPGELPSALPGPDDTSGLIRYRERYTYDAVGNIRRMHHQPLAPRYEAWERRYLYANMPESGAAVRSNRLLATSIPGDIEGVFSARYAYSDGTDTGDRTNNAGLHGSMTRMPHLPSIQWDYADRMRRCALNDAPTPDTVYFTYDASGTRVRKVYEHTGLREERIYLGGYEVYRRVRGSGTAQVLEVHRTTLHVLDDQRRVAMVENTLVDPVVATGRRWRFQLDNHLGSATLEVDHEGNVIGYEEYHPYGTSAVRVERSAAGFSQKRYRYTGKERDEETSLYYHGARYYAPWLGRWTAADPMGMVDGLNLYRYSRDNPIRYSDPGGTQATGAQATMLSLVKERLSQEIAGIIEGFAGGKAHVSVEANKVDYSPPEGGMGGVTGGVARAATLRAIPMEKDPSPASRMGMEFGASMVPGLDPAAKLATGETVTGLETSRLWAAAELAVDVAPAVMELGFGFREARANMSLVERAKLPDIPAAERPTLPDIPAAERPTLPDVPTSERPTLPELPAAERQRPSTQPAEKRILALGTQTGKADRGGPGGGPPLHEFAKSVGAKTLEQMTPAKKGAMLIDEIPAAIEQADEIHFKMDNLTPIEQTLSAGTSICGAKPDCWTAYEFKVIWEDQALLDKTTFYLHPDWD